MENVQIQLVEHNNHRILTTAQIAAAYGANPQLIVNNFNRNKDRYTSGKHYYCLEGEELAAFKETTNQFDLLPKSVNKLYLWTEKGALMHAKSLNTDKAWEAYETLVDEYYRLIHQSPPLFQKCTLGDALRKRVLANEDHVPDDLFATLVEYGKELYYWEQIVNAELDNEAQMEISIGKCWVSYAKKFLNPCLQERRRYRHQLPNGRIVLAWGYPMKYLSAFRRWLRDVYFPEKFLTYQRYRAKRIGVEPKGISAKTLEMQILIARSGMVQLPLFSEAIA